VHLLVNVKFYIKMHGTTMKIWSQCLDKGHIGFLSRFHWKLNVLCQQSQFLNCFKHKVQTCWQIDTYPWTRMSDKIFEYTGILRRANW